MKTIFMLKYFFSIGFFFLSFNLGFCQEKKKDSIVPKIERFGLRLGVDAVKLATIFFDKNYKGLEFSGDYRLTKRYYLAAELGNETKTTKDEHLDFTTKGTFLKAGFDYNLYENWTGMRNLVTIGLRYGASTFSQTLNSYRIYNSDQYFGISQSIETGQKFDGLSAQWVELVLGTKVEVFNNIFVGFSIRGNKILSNSKPENFDNLYIPGFNRTYNGDFGVGFNYTISYFFPIYKTSNAKKLLEKPKK